VIISSVPHNVENS